MKKIISTIIVVLLLSLFIPSFCFAENSFNIDELGFTVSIPSDTYVFTRNTDNSSSDWSLFNIDPTEFKSYMKSNNIYLNAATPDGAYEIVIIGTKDEEYCDLVNLNLYEDEEIYKTLSASWDNISGDLGLTKTYDAVYHSGQIKYYSYAATQTTEGQEVYVKCYISIVNSTFYQINFRSYTGPLSSQQEQVIKSVVDSVTFKEIQNPPEPISYSDQALDDSEDYSGYSESSWYKGLVAGIVALLAAIIYNIFHASKKKQVKEADNKKEQASSDSINYSNPSTESTFESTKPDLSQTNTEDTNGREESPDFVSDMTLKSAEKATEKTAASDTKKEPQRYCHMCGSLLLEGSVFCSKCGTKVWTGDIE